MDRILPGVFHWKTEHPSIHSQVSSYWLADGGVLIDPLVPSDLGLDWFAEQETTPAAIILSCRHHYRDSAQFRERFDVTVHVPRAGVHEFQGERRPVSPYDTGDELPGGLLVEEVGSISPDDKALYLAASRAVFFGDGLVNGSAGLGFVGDSLMDEPERTKQGLLESLRRILAQADFDHVLPAHGDPVVGDGRHRLEEMVQAGGRTAWAG
jgi:glyoxylase-like metal-dependent hydrolase (beta-lactamase superfamily II)